MNRGVKRKNQIWRPLIRNFINYYKMKGENDEKMDRIF